MTDEYTSATVLIVDDDPICRELLEYHIRSLGLYSLCAEDGQEALNIIEQMHPQVVFLDLNMPNVCGNEFLQSMDKKGFLGNVSVIVISSSDSAEVVANSIKLGADDHIVKPFDPIILNARLESSLTRQKLRKFEENEKERLEKLVQARTFQLNDANEQLKGLDEAKNEFLNVLSHELRTPLSGLTMAQIAFEDRDISESELKAMSKDFQDSFSRLEELIEQASLLTQLSTKSIEFTPDDCNLVDVITATVSYCEGREISISYKHDASVSSRLLVNTDCELLIRGLTAFFSSAAKFCSEGNQLEVSLDCGEEQFAIKILATGYQIPESDIEKVFCVLAIEKAIFPGGQLGLGLALGSRIVDQLGGKINVKNQGADSVLFEVLMPLR